MAKSLPYSIRYPDDLDDRGWVDAEAKGALFGVVLVIGGQEKQIVVYDNFSLAESISHDLARNGYYCEGIVLVVRSVTLANVESAISMMASYEFRELS
jgi:hypothetical protein